MIQRFYVNNFRGLDNFELPVSEHSSVLLIGKNGSGKSSVGFALEVLQRIGRGTNRIGQLLKPSDFTLGRSDVPIRFEIQVKLLGAIYDYHLALELPEGFKELRVVEEKLSHDGSEIFVRERAQVTLIRASGDHDASFGIDWHLAALPLIQERSEKDPLFIFKNWLSRMLILAPIPSQICGRSEGDTLTPNRHVKNFAEWFTGLFARSPAAYGHIAEYLKEIMPDFESADNPPSGDQRNLFVKFQRDEASVTLPFGDLSDGEKCFFICALVLASNKIYGPLFCFWDEPDSHLAISEVGHFIMALRRSFKHSGGQILVTSHNPEAIRKFSEENIFLLDRRSHLEPTIMRPAIKVPVIGDFVDALIRDDVEA